MGGSPPPLSWKVRAVIRRLLCLVLLLPAFAHADVDPRFARLRDTAEPLGGLGAFLDRYIGECGSLFASSDCRTKADAFRKHYRGKRMYMIVTEEVATMVAPGAYQPNTGHFSVHITPVFPGGRYALTDGTPKKTDAEGTPVVPALTVTGTSPRGWNGGVFSRLFSSQGVRVQVIFTPMDIWTLTQPSGGKTFGVAARIEAILVTEGRTGQELGLWLEGKDAPKKK
nr:DUF6066 family protein [Stigmatella aurantiaca]